MKKQLLAIFGPVVAALILTFLFFFSPFKVDDQDPALWAKAASSMSGNVLRGDSIKNQAIASGDYVPFFGSSELSRISPFHPSVLAEKYQRGYTPFLLGAPGTQSLTQFMMMDSFGKELDKKKIVFIISPQWFVKGGVTRDYFDAYFSELQTYVWVTKLTKIEEKDRFLAERLLKYDKVTHDQGLVDMLTCIKAGQLPTANQLHNAQWHINLLEREDELFSKIGLISKEDAIQKNVKLLPTSYDFDELDRLAKAMGQKNTNNNSFEIENDFYKTRLESHLQKLNNSQKDWDYRYSPEFSDFQLVLTELAQHQTDALFIIPPVNKLWSEYTGLSQDMMQQFSNKITYQLRSQGFKNIADFTQMSDVQYFMADTIHLGWRGWLKADQYIAPFLKEKYQPLSYQLNDRFFSEEWQNQDPATIQ